MKFMRKKIVAGNWKMNVNLNESIDLIESIKKIYDHSENVEVCIAPSFPFLKESSELGHSERREYYNEDDDLLLRKLKVSLENNFKVYFCIGESLEDRDKNNHFEKVKNQLEKTVFKIDNIDPENLVFAYEPIWAIGTGETASLQDIIEVVSEVKKFIESKPFYNEEKIKFVYGGSVSPNNSEEILNSNIINGALVGGASLDVEQFVKIIESIEL